MSWFEFILKSQDKPNKNLSEASVLKVFPLEIIPSVG